MQNVVTAIAANLRAMRGKHNLSQPELAEILDLERKAVAARLEGRVPVTAAEIAVLVRRLDEPLEAFFAGVVDEDAA